jgi:uncharacterized protein
VAIDLTPLVPVGRQVIERYGPSGFRISGAIHPGPLLVFPDRIMPWTSTTPAAITWESLTPVIEHGGVEILLLGFGRRIGILAGPLRSALRQAGIAAEPMDTGAACRTFNVLVAEDRLVAAALIPPL